ncbi:hypothetical protein NIES3806_35040 [Microcystis aeruginosa NIES-3806]|uniref:hypothetical protein n=1 Tax=Microcystis aeruginosa TaxID=1126 RepID=UPI00130A32CB|nr:hypothetical protein [Microcystis aeruginosa]GCL56145.1 hypothetical protein NIES3806_35040 [Microcystis aeruginosa NIES-3806]
MDLADALRLISQIKDIIPIKLEKLSQSFGELQIDSQEFISNTKDHHEEIIASLAKARILLNQLPEQIILFEVNLENSIRILEAEIKDWEDFFASNQEELNQEIRQVWQQLQILKAQIFNSRDRQLAVQKESKKALNNLWQTVYRKQELLTVTLASVQQEIYKFQRQIESNHDMLTEKVSFLEKELEQNQDEIDVAVRDLVDSKLGKMQTKITQDLDDIAENFDRNYVELIDLMTDKIEDDFKAPMELELNKYLEKIACVAGLSEINISQDEVADKFKSMDDLSPDIIALVEEIYEAKTSIGIDN